MNTGCILYNVLIFPVVILEAVGASCGELRELDVTFCGGVTEEGLEGEGSCHRNPAAPAAPPSLLLRPLFSFRRSPPYLGTGL